MRQIKPNVFSVGAIDWDTDGSAWMVAGATPLDTADLAANDIPPGTTEDIWGLAASFFNRGVVHVETTCACSDIDGDGTVGVADLLAVLAAWGHLGGVGDVTGDGLVDVADLLTVLADWGPCA